MNENENAARQNRDRLDGEAVPAERRPSEPGETPVAAEARATAPKEGDSVEPSVAADVADPESVPTSRMVVLLFGLLLGGALTLGAFRLGPALLAGPPPDSAGAGTGMGTGHEEAEEVWTCPMHPFVVSDQPGACPVCGMDLVLRTSTTGYDPAELARLGRVAVSPVERVLANVATVPVGRTDLTTDMRAYGRLVYDETSYATIPAWVGGRVERLYVEETGTEVDRGQRLLSIYSPDLLAAQEEYLVILRSGGVAEGMRESAERRLRLLGLSRRQIRRLAERGETSDTVTVYAPASGTIVERLVQEGEYVTEGQPLFRLAGEQNIWVEADVFEQDVPFVEEGMQAEVELVAFPGETFSGIVTLVWPFLDAETRTLRVRVEFESVDPRFRAGMYATVLLSAEMVHDAVVVPAEAVIRTGNRNAVYVEIEENLFERRQVDLGYRSHDLFEILSGVEPGEEVVARGGFLIDSEAQLYSGGESLHFDHTAHEQGTMAGAHLEAFEQLPVGEYFCPTDPDEHASEPGRCERNNLPYVRKEEGTTFDPHADPVDLVPVGEWYCPMGAEWVSDEPGRCPICGMTLIQKTDDEAHAAHHTASASGAAEGSGAATDPLAGVPMGDYFCPTDPSEHQAEPGRCSTNNIQMIQRTEDLAYEPDADNLTWVHPGEWYCPMGAEWVSEEPGSCPICGMHLVQMENGGQGE